MANLLALVLTAAEHLLTKLLTGKLCSFTYVTGCSLRLLSAVTKNLHVDVAWWARARMAQDVANLVFTIFVFRFVAMLTAAVWQDKGVVVWLAESATETVVDR